jgi:hypothetical protein
MLPTRMECHPDARNGGFRPSCRCPVPILETRTQVKGTPSSLGEGSSRMIPPRPATSKSPHSTPAIVRPVVRGMRHPSVNSSDRQNQEAPA